MVWLLAPSCLRYLPGGTARPWFSAVADCLPLRGLPAAYRRLARVAAGRWTAIRRGRSLSAHGLCAKAKGP